MNKISREEAIKKVIELTNEIDSSKKVNKLFELAKSHRDELEIQVEKFKQSRLYKKIKQFDEQFPKGPLFVSKKKENIGGFGHAGLKPYDKRINPTAMLFLIISMPTHKETDFFQNHDDLVEYLKNSGKLTMSDFLRKQWLSGDMADLLWNIYDQDD